MTPSVERVEALTPETVAELRRLTDRWLNPLGYKVVVPGMAGAVSSEQVASESLQRLLPLLAKTLPALLNREEQGRRIEALVQALERVVTSSRIGSASRIATEALERERQNRGAHGREQRAEIERLTAAHSDLAVLYGEQGRRVAELEAENARLKRVAEQAIHAGALKIDQDGDVDSHVGWVSAGDVPELVEHLRSRTRGGGE